MNNPTNGEILRNTVEAMISYVKYEGHPVIVNNQGTLEIINFGFKLAYSSLIDLVDIRKHMTEYYEQNNIDISSLEELERAEYSIITTKLYEKFKLFKQDKNSRQVLFTDNCCISMIQFLIRNNSILCFMNMRSSDVENKLFSDLYLIHRIIRKLQESENLNCVKFMFNANSLHKINYKL